MIAACTLQPGTYFSVNSGAGMVGGTPQAAVATITNWGFPVTAEQMAMLAHNVGEKTLFFRTGGAPAFALGMAKIFSDSLGGAAVMALWYHFAIMFEALFILTVLDAGTRVGRFMLQDALGHIWKPLGRTSSYPSVIFTSALMVGAWGYFLWQGIRDPLGGINSLWPIFGICNQLLAAVALCVATTIIVKMGRARYMWVTLAPLAWLAAVTFSAAWHKVFDPNPLIGLLAHARQLASTQAAAGAQAASLARRIFNDRLDAAVCGLLIVLVSAIVVESAMQWISVVSGRKQAATQESPFVATAYAEEAL
jgi:carbon starvation protein